MIRVAIDARRLQDRPLHGVGRGLANLIPHLTPQVDVTLLFDRSRPSYGAVQCAAAELAGYGRVPEPAWLQVSVPMWLRRHPMVFHGPYNAVPYAAPDPCVATIHDLAWEHHPEDYSSRGRREIVRAQARWAVRRSRVIVTVSEFIRRSIIDTYDVEAERVVVAPNSIDPAFSPTQAASSREVLARFGVTGPYVVALGGARRRGLGEAVEAWRRASSGLTQAPWLVVVGGEAPPSLPNVAHIGRVDDATWTTVLAGAVAFCYATRYEGFGMPALEAAASGVPVVCASIGPLPEVLGDAAEWCASPYAADLAEGLRRILTDESRRESLRAAGLARAATSPTWEDSAATLVAAYKTAAA
ncbi:MAG: glycosyltransferase family 4 protein [Frankiaceae bacterium]|nr:glycosyltransferase family 4 protein [Frankiaceae bacterium]MBV9870274.1 glycosyltransferase family 4 protein [Frankiaceae bacterium]